MRKQTDTATTKTSISLDPEVLEKAKDKVANTGQSVSSYINVLIRQDLGLFKNGRKVKQVSA